MTEVRLRAVFLNKLTKSTVECATKKKKKRDLWTDNEDQLLREGVGKYGRGRWKKIAELFMTKDYTGSQLSSLHVERWRSGRGRLLRCLPGQSRFGLILAFVA